jgi:hypothetical protein
VALAEWRFSQPSLLERRCPHYVPREERLVRAGAMARLSGGADEAGRLFRAALETNPRYLPALVGWASIELGRGGSPAVVAARLEQAAADSADSELLAVLGDARQLAGDRVGARRAYRGALAAMPPYAHEARAAMALRMSVDPAALHLLHVAGRHAEIARLLEDAGTTDATRYFAAGRWLAAGDPARALDVLQSMPPPVSPAAQGALHAWRARYARMAGLPGAAAVEAAEAAHAYATARLPAAERHQRDRAAEARWVATRPGTFRRPGS